MNKKAEDPNPTPGDEDDIPMAFHEATTPVDEERLPTADTLAPAGMINPQRDARSGRFLSPAEFGFDSETHYQPAHALPAPPIVRPFICSDGVAMLFGALAAAQGMFSDIEADKENKHLKSKYASLGSYLNSVRPGLEVNGLAVIQIPSIGDSLVEVQTLITHMSGEWISCSVDSAYDTNNLQMLGTAITYLRKYSLCAMLGLSQYDSDGEEETGAQAAGEALSDDHALHLTEVATQLFGSEEAGVKELTSIAKLLFRVDDYALIQDKHYETALENLRNKAGSN